MAWNVAGWLLRFDGAFWFAARATSGDGRTIACGTGALPSSCGHHWESQELRHSWNNTGCYGAVLRGACDFVVQYGSGRPLFMLALA